MKTTRKRTHRVSPKTKANESGTIGDLILKIRVDNSQAIAALDEMEERLTNVIGLMERAKLLR